MSPNTGNLFIISSVAGGGKSTIISRILEKHPEILFSTSCTSREIRKGEIPDISYHFISKEEFQSLIEKDYFYEWAMVHDNYYGTPKDFIIENLEKGKKIILDIDVQGAAKVKASLPSSISIFILPPSQEIWMERLRSRGTDSHEVIEKRIRNGIRELEKQDSFDYKIVNDQLDDAVLELEKILFL